MDGRRASSHIATWPYRSEEANPSIAGFASTHKQNNDTPQYHFTAARGTE
jgi:hypothetical protein